jgi:hypothetical protein
MLAPVWAAVGERASARFPASRRGPSADPCLSLFRRPEVAALSRQRDPIADELTRELVRVAPWTASPVYAPEVEAWAWNEARCRVLRAYEDEHGLLSDEGASAAGELHRAETRAASARANLGIGGPLALARVLGALSSTTGESGEDALEQLRAEGRRIVAVHATAAVGASLPASAPETAENGLEGEEGASAS